MSATASVDTLPSGVIHVSNPWPRTDGPDFELVEDLRIGRLSGSGPDVFGEILDLAVDAEGRIYVLDIAAKQVRAFDAEGSHLWTVGREGEGPGELSYPIGLMVGSEGRVWVVDAGNSRYSVFGDGELIEERARHVMAGIVPWNGGFDRSGRLWESYDSYPVGLVAMLGLVGLDDEFVPADSLNAVPVETGYFRERDGSWSGQHVPFAPWVTWAFDPRGYVLVGDAGAYVIRQLSLAGDTVRVFQLPYEPVRVQPAELDSALASLESFRRRGGIVDAALIPRVKPAFEAVFVGVDGRAWTYLHLAGDALSPGPQETWLDVFGPDGVHQGVARAMSRLEPFTPPPVFTETHAYAAALDEFEVQYVVRLRIDPVR